MDWLDNPAVQGGVVPLVMSLAIASVLAFTGRVGRTPVAWLGVVAGYVASTALAAGLSFSPLTATRKIVLIVVVGAVAGLAADIARAERSRGRDLTFAIAAGLAAAWAFQSILVQRDAAIAAGMAAAIAAYAFAQTLLVVRQSDDGIRVGAIGVGLGIGTGVCAILSASIGFLLSGIAIAAGAGGLLMVQVLARRPMRAGYTGAVGVGLSCALFALGAIMLAEMPWYAAPLLLGVPLGVHALDPVRKRPMARASILVAVAVLLALLPIAAAWYAARASLT